MEQQVGSQRCWPFCEYQDKRYRCPRWTSGAEYNLSDKVNLIAGLDNYVLGDERIPNGYLGLSISFGTPKRS